MLNRLEQYRDAAAEDAGAFDMRDAMNFVWRQWKLILTVTAISLLLGSIHVARQTPLYTATAQLFLDPSREKNSTQDVLFTELMLFDQSAIESQMAIIRSSAMLKRVVEKERLTTDSEYGGAPPAAPAKGLLTRLWGWFPGSTAATSEQNAPAPAIIEPFDAASPATISTIEAIKGAINVQRAGQAYVLNVSFTSANPNKAARLANAVADAYVVDKLDARFESAKRASTWLSERLVDLRKQLRESEEAVTRFRAENNLSETKAGTLNQDQIGQLNARLVAARAETAEKKTRVEILQRIEAKGGNITALPDTMATGAIVDLRKQANDISRQEADLLARYNRNHPSVVNIHAQLADIQRAINAESQRLAANIRNDYELAKARQDAMEKTLREATGQADIDSTKAITLRELERTAAVNKSLFEDFLQRARVTQEQSTFEAREARVITPALPPGAPSSPKRMQAMLTALLIGLVAGVGGAYALEFFNAGFTTPRQIESLLELPLLASISRMDSRELTVDGAVHSIPQYAVAKPLSRFNEELRSLRNAIQMSDVDRPPKVLQISSSVPGEGKTTLTLSLACSATFSGIKTLVIDADLRRSSASRYFGAEKNKGLVDYLVGEADLRSVIYLDESTKVWVLPAGGRTQNPADLLGSEKLKALIGMLRAQFELIVIDTPPTAPVVDSIIISSLVDKVIFVVRWSSTAREVVSHSIQRLGGHPKVAGVVFSQVIDSHAQKYGKYGYARYYGGRNYESYYNG